MPFSEDIKMNIEHYINLILPPEEWYLENYSFIEDETLRNRIITEFKNARRVYKFFEGMQATEDFKCAEIRIQLLMYASIYEAIVHYLLFDKYKNAPEVVELVKCETYKKIDIPSVEKEKLKKSLFHNGKDIIPMFKEKSKKDISKIRFDDKCHTACKMGIITEKLCDELIKIYELRNCLHIHAEIKKDVEYELEMSRTAYRRMQVFREQVQKYCSEHN